RRSGRSRYSSRYFFTLSVRKPWGTTSSSGECTPAGQVMARTSGLACSFANSMMAAASLPAPASSLMLTCLTSFWADGSADFPHLTAVGVAQRHLALARVVAGEAVGVGRPVHRPAARRLAALGVEVGGH